MPKPNVATPVCSITRLTLCLALMLAAGGVASGRGGEPVRLGDGQTFAGWEGDTAGANPTWRVVEGAFVGGSLTAPVRRNEFLCTTRPYTNFVLRLQFKLLGEGANAGVQIRSRRIPDHHEMIGYQADLGGPAWWGCLYDESRRNRVLAQADPAQIGAILKRGDWNTYVIRCEGRRIQLAINGHTTVDYTEADETLEQAGLIGLQIHGGPPSEAWYRELTIEELP